MSVVGFWLSSPQLDANKRSIGLDDVCLDIKYLICEFLSPLSILRLCIALNLNESCCQVLLSENQVVKPSISQYEKITFFTELRGLKPSIQPLFVEFLLCMNKIQFRFSLRQPSHKYSHEFIHAAFLTSVSDAHPKLLKDILSFFSVKSLLRVFLSPYFLCPAEAFITVKRRLECMIKFQFSPWVFQTSTFGPPSHCPYNGSSRSSYSILNSSNSSFSSSSSSSGNNNNNNNAIPSFLLLILLFVHAQTIHPADPEAYAFSKSVLWPTYNKYKDYKTRIPDILKERPTLHALRDPLWRFALNRYGRGSALGFHRFVMDSQSNLSVNNSNSLSFLGNGISAYYGSLDLDLILRLEANFLSQMLMIGAHFEHNKIPRERNLLKQVFKRIQARSRREKLHGKLELSPLNLFVTGKSKEVIQSCIDLQLDEGGIECVCKFLKESKAMGKVFGHQQFESFSTCSF